MKIAITGTHSTGKSTFIERLRTDLRGARVQVIGNLATEAREHGFPILRDHTFSSTLWMMTRGISLEQEAGLDHDLVVADRPVMEPIAYLYAALKTQSRSITPEQEACLHAIAQSYSFTYRLIIKTVVDTSLPISAEKERDHDQDFRLLADQEIDALHARLGLDVIELRHGDDASHAALIKQIRSLLPSRNA